jgi:hypothetical protein
MRSSLHNDYDIIDNAHATGSVSTDGCVWAPEHCRGGDSQRQNGIPRSEHCWKQSKSNT